MKTRGTAEVQSHSF